MRLSDLPRSTDRAIVTSLYNGNPPFDEATAEENGVQINRNFLEGPNMLARARRQLDTALIQGGNYYPISLDSGPIHKRRDWSSIITRNLNRPLKESSDYLETIQSTTAGIVLHGIAPVTWKNRKSPIPCALGIESLMIPSDTYRSFDNLEYYAVFREWTPTQLYDLTHGPRADPGWNMKMVNERLRYVATEFRKSQNSSAYQYMPERIEELIKQDKGFWGSDAVPTIDVWDFYFREYEDGCGWFRRIVLDWGIGMSASDRIPEDTNSSFLYTSGKRKYANKLSEILHCQFGDASAVPPFRYHSVRSLGWMLWGVCDLMNRMRCQFTQSVFEQLMWFFRTNNSQDFERLKKANFTHMGVIPNGISFIPAQERFQPNANLVEMAFEGNRQLMSENTAGFTPAMDMSTNKEMKATEIIARENAANAMASGMLVSIYQRQKMQGMEIARRMCIKNSTDPISKKFRLACMKEGVPEEFLDVERWNVDVERVIGGGNVTLQVSQAKALMEARPQYDPDSQTEILHIYTEAITQDASLAERLVPIGENKIVSDATYINQLAAGALLMGLEVSMKRGQNHIDACEALLAAMAVEIKKIEAKGGMADEEEIFGLVNLAGVGKPLTHGGIQQHIQIISQDEEEKQRAKQYGDDLGKMMNLVKAYGQRLQEKKQEAAQSQNGQMDPKDNAKIQGMLMISDAKAKNMRESHGARTAQKQVQFELGEKRKDQQHKLDMQRTIQEQDVEDTTEAMKTVAEIKRGSLHSNEKDT